MDNGSGVGVLDKAALVLTALEAGPATLARTRRPGTGLARPTAHRLAVALEHHRLVARDMQGRFVLGPQAQRNWPQPPARTACSLRPGPVLARLRDITGESAQLWRRQGDDHRSLRGCRCRAPESGLRDTIPDRFSQLTMRAGSAAQVLLAWEDPERMHRGLHERGLLRRLRLSGIRRRGWAQSIGEREQGVASVSAPVRSPGGKVIAAVSVSGPLERLTRQPGRMHAPAVLAAADRLSRVTASFRAITVQRRSAQ
jgi:DNA-binding IclR family transcriptional regulator